VHILFNILGAQHMVVLTQWLDGLAAWAIFFYNACFTGQTSAK